MIRFIPLLCGIALISGCVAPSKPQAKKARPVAASPETKQCLADLGAVRARFTLLPDQDFGNGCSIKGAVSLTAAPIPVTNIKAVQCGVARAFAQWIATDVQAAAQRHFGARVVQVDTMGSYSCRQMIGNGSGKLSEHGRANALDIGGFVLSDGRRVTVEGGWNGSDRERDFLRAVRSGACKRFQTVLSPDYNAAHYNHLHFDMGRGPYCR
jgi:hypothetical protein